MANIQETAKESSFGLGHWRDLAISALRPVAFRGKYRLLNSITPTSGERTARVFGYTMRLDLSDWIQRNMYFGSYEMVESAWVRQYLRPGMTVVDVGANVGFYTALAARCVGPTGRVFAIEPSTRVYERLRQMISSNDLSQVSACNVGLGDQEGERGLYAAEEGPDAISLPGMKNHTPTMVAGGRRPFEQAPVLRLDLFAREKQVSRIDLLKLDIQGWEPKVLLGAQRLLEARAIRAVLCEFDAFWLHEVGSSIEELWSTFARYGFSLRPSLTLDQLIESRIPTRLLMLEGP